MALLTDRFQSAAKGEGSVVLVAGESGIGKTRLTAECRKRIEKAGGQTALGCCLEYAQSPFAPFLDALRGLVGANATAARASDSVAATLSHLLPDADLPRAVSLPDQPSDKLCQYRDVTRFLTECAKVKPVVIVIEDLHWADIASLEYLRYLLTNVAMSRLIIVATYRPEELSRDHPLRSTLARIERSPCLWRIQLESLDDDDMNRLVADAGSGHAPLPPDQLSDVLRRAEGNPLVAEELMKNAFERVAAGSQRDRLPLSVREAVSERLARLGSRECSVLACASAIGNTFDPEFLAEIVAEPVADVARLLRAAIDAQLVVENDGPIVRYAFRHSITRDAVHQQLLAAERRPLHERIAEKLEALPPTVERVAELAFHWWEAGQLVKAAHYNQLAGDAARRLYAAADAAAYYERALDCGVYQGAERACLLAKLGDACYDSALSERGRRALEAASAYFEATGDAMQSARVYVSLSRVCWSLGDADATLAMAKRAVALAAHDPANPIFFDAHVQAAKAHLIAWFDTDSALGHFRQAESVPPPWPPHGEANFYGYRALAELAKGDIDAGVADRDRAIEAVRRDDDWETAVQVWGNFGARASHYGDRALAMEAFEYATASVREKGLRTAWMLLQQALALLRFGELGRCRALVEQALPSCSEAYRARILAAQAGIGAGLRLEDHDLVRRCDQPELVEMAFRSGGLVVSRITIAYVELYLAQGKRDAARALLRRAIEALAAFPSGIGGEDNWVYVLAAAHADPDVVAKARALLPETAKVKSKATPAIAAMFAAHEARRGGDREAAQKHALDAAAVFASLQWPDCEAQSYELAGLSARALEIYRRIGAVRDAHRLSAELTPVNRRGQPKTGLTHREREIAQLVADGKSNREIGTVLCISERTVETHVASIFGKLGLSNRAQIASNVSSNRVSAISEDE